MTDKYILDDQGNPHPCDDVVTWGRWFETHDRHVGDDHLQINDVEVHVSTVFLGIDHNFAGADDAILWETMVFGGALDQEMQRYGSHESTIKGHQAMLARVKATATEQGDANHSD